MENLAKIARHVQKDFVVLTLQRSTRHLISWEEKKIEKVAWIIEFWQDVKEELMDMMTEFYHGYLDINIFNYAHVLL